MQGAGEYHAPSRDRARPVRRHVFSTGKLLSKLPNSPTFNVQSFSGIHVFSPTLFPLMDEWPDRFSIIDFYLKVCDRADIRGVADDHLRLLDVGKLDSLAQAEQLLHSIQ